MKARAQIFLLTHVLRKLGDAEYGTYEVEFRKGMLRTDWPDISICGVHLGVGGMFHFYHPKEKTIFPNAKSLALNRMKRAKELYSMGKIRHAYYELGKVFHLLTGVAIPAHAKFIFHPFDTDDLEVFLESYIDEKSTVKISAAKHQNLEQMFDELARKAAKYKCEHNGIFISLGHVLFGGKKKLDKKELKKQADEILPLAASYGYALLKLFKEWRIGV